MGDFSKLAKGLWGDVSSGVKKIPGEIDHRASLVGLAGIKQANKVGASPNSGLYVGSMLSKGVKYGTYGAAGAATVGAAVGIVDRDRTMVGGAATGALSGAGLGAVAGAGVGAATVAAAIAKSVR